jgi:ABC-type antimicrobial peptide transport system permease subunit
LYKIFAGIAIFISCLGLYGLVSFMAVQRTKEVGIRKVLGASVQNIVYLFSKEFTVLIIIAFVISAPIGIFLMHKWLQNYTYRIELSASIFFISYCRVYNYCMDSCWAPCNKSSDCKPCEKFENEMISNVII